MICLHRFDDKTHVCLGQYQLSYDEKEIFICFVQLENNLRIQTIYTMIIIDYLNVIDFPFFLIIMHCLLITSRYNLDFYVNKTAVIAPSHFTNLYGKPNYFLFEKLLFDICTCMLDFQVFLKRYAMN